MKRVYRVTCGNGHTFDGEHNTTHCPECDEKVSWNWKITSHLQSELTPDQLRSRVLDWLERHEPNFNYGTLQECDGGELIILANWNALPPKLPGFIEDWCACTTGFNDEHSSCSDCGAIISETPEYYGDQKNYILLEAKILCRQCATDAPSDIIEYYKNDPQKVVKTWFIPMLKAEGFHCLEREGETCPIYETGLHYGQNDDPRTVAEWIEANLPGYDYIFALTDVGQFDIHWTAFIRKIDKED